MPYSQSQDANQGAANAALSPRLRGVFTAQKFSELLPQHQKIIQRIVREVLHLGTSEVEVESRILKKLGPGVDPADAYHSSVLGRQPHQSFLIDGPKGSGKTTLLLNLRCALEQIGPNGSARRPAHTFCVTELDRGSGATGDKLNEYNELTVGRRARFLVQALPVIRPDAFEADETIMEYLFAEMAEQLERVVKADDASLPSSVSSGSVANNRDKKEQARKLKQELQREVARGWYFARQLGLEALLNDSMNFDDYIERRAQEAVVGHRRISRWMRFVNEYLDFFDSQLLAIFIDDTDISADLAADILHTTRMFFCHPRIVVMLAGNMHTMRQRLLTRAMSQQAEAHRSLRAPDSFTASFWRDFERDNIEEYLSKVLPRPYRHFISPSDAITERALLRGQSFDQFCAEQMRARLREFLRERATTRRRSESDHRLRWSRYEALLKLAQEPNRYHIHAENHVALWLLRNHYAAYLSPRTARHINQFRAMIDRHGSDKSGGEQERTTRRVVVALFTHPSNFSVIQRQSDFDGDASAWINRQAVKSHWRGARWIRLNELTLPYGSPSYELLLFRLDLDLSRPDSAWLSPKFPTDLLPEPAGRKIWAPEVWQEGNREGVNKFLSQGFAPGRQPIVEQGDTGVRFRQDLLGVAHAFSSPVIPANCMYFKDLRGIPDIAWTWDQTEDADYRRFFDQFPLRNIDNIFRLDRFDHRSDYFRNVVLVFASYPLVKPIPSEEFITEALPLHARELSDFDGLGREQAEIKTFRQGQSQFQTIERVSGEIAKLYRRALAGHDRPILSADLATIDLVSPNTIAKRLLREDLFQPDANELEARKRAARRAAERIVSQIAPRYHRILNDVRRAYHAMRILEADINNYAYIARIGQRANGANGTTDVADAGVWPTPFQHSRNDLYTLIDLDKFRTLIGLPVVRSADRKKSDISLTSTRLEDRSVCDTRYWIPIGHKEVLREARLLKPFSCCVKEELLDTSPPEKAIFAKLSVGRHAPIFGPSQQSDPATSGDASSATDNCVFQFARPTTDILFGDRTWSIEGMSDKSKHLHKLLSSISIHKGATERGASGKAGTAVLLFDTRQENDAEQSRMYRSLLLALWGLGPCLSSLIHLDIMGRYFGSHGGDDLEAKQFCLATIADNLDDWEVTIGYAMINVVVLGVTLEVNLDRDFKTFNSKNGDRPAFCAIPDVSIAPLGLRLFSSDDQSAEQPDFTKRKFSGIIGDTLLRLQLAHYYISELRGSFGKVWSQLDKTTS